MTRRPKPPSGRARRGRQEAWTTGRRRLLTSSRHSFGRLLTRSGEPHEPRSHTDPQVARELHELYELDLANREPGVDLRSQAYSIARTEVTRCQLEQSDALVENLPGHGSLRPRRRR